MSLPLINLFKQATINDTSPIFTTLKSNPNLLISLHNSTTAIHLLATYSHINTLKKIITLHPNFINITDSKNQTVTHILFNNLPFIKFSLTLPNTDLNIIDSNNDTILTKNIKFPSKNSLSIIDLLAPKSNPSLPSESPPLLLATQIQNSQIIDILLSHNYNSNIKNKSYITPLITATNNNSEIIIKKLISHNADINYIGPFGENSILEKIIKTNNVKLFNFLLSHNADTNIQNRNLETPLHVAIKYKVYPSMISKLIYLSDLSLKNINGETPLHLLIKSNTWENYTEFLKEKNINILQRDDRRNNILDYLKNKNLNSFLQKVIIPKYLHTKCKNISLTKCETLLKKHILETKSLSPSTITDINLLAKNYQNKGTFNSDIIHNIIYTLHLLTKYKTLTTPFQFHNPDKFLNDKIIQIHNNLYSTTNIFMDLIETYTDVCYNISPYLIIWKNENLFYIHPNFSFYFNAALTTPKRFIFLKVTFVVNENSTHANIIIYDKKSNTIERFEPYGIIPLLNNDKFDTIIHSKISTIIPNVTYLTPSDLFKNKIGFQMLSDDEKIYIKKQGDPGGFCLAWTYWYLEERLTNPDINPKELISSKIESIRSNINEINKDNVNPFVDYIRNYSEGLTKGKNDILKDAGINEYHWYDNVLPDREMEKLTKYISKKLENIL